MLMGSLHETESRLYVSSWKKLWKLVLPPKIISSLWRLCNSFIPVSVRLLDKSMNLPTCRVLCGQGLEHYWHLFYDCPYSSSCWTAANVDKPSLTTDEFPVWLLKLIADLDPDVMFDSNDLMECMEATKPEAMGELFTTSSEGGGAGVCVFPGLASSSCWRIFPCCSTCSWTSNLVSSFRRSLEVQSGYSFVS